MQSIKKKTVFGCFCPLKSKKKEINVEIIDPLPI